MTDPIQAKTRLEWGTVMNWCGVEGIEPSRVAPGSVMRLCLSAVTHLGGVFDASPPQQRGSIPNADKPTD